jgi:hypothetical protein
VLEYVTLKNCHSGTFGEGDTPKVTHWKNKGLASIIERTLFKRMNVEKKHHD